MNTETKIHLSKLETELIQNKEWILTKRSVINKLYQFFAEMQKIYKEIAEQETSSVIQFYKHSPGKISKGENYKEFPYVILDYPAVFSKENIFAIRTMFWWGHFFSVSLHLSGKEFQLTHNFSGVFLYLKEKDFSVCVNDNEWQHHFEHSNYVQVAKLDKNSFDEILKKNFFKISKNMELNRWEDAPEFLKKTFREIIEFLKISFPAGEINLSPGFPKAGSGL